jgi:hypothetical protein
LLWSGKFYHRLISLSTTWMFVNLLKIIWDVPKTKIGVLIMIEKYYKFLCVVLRRFFWVVKGSLIFKRFNKFTQIFEDLNRSFISKNQIFMKNLHFCLWWCGHFPNFPLCDKDSNLRVIISKLDVFDSWRRGDIS